VRRKSLGRLYDDLNVTPLLDLAWVLLIVFIIMATATVQGITVDLPRASNAPRLAEPENRQAQAEDEGRSDGLDVSMPTTDAGLGPTDTQLAVDAEAEAGFDSFGLGAKRGGRDLALDLGKPERAGGGCGGSSGFTNYTAQLGTYLDSWLNRDDSLRRSTYALHARIWFDPDGAVERCILQGTTGDAALDQQIVARLSAARPPNGPPPSDLPQPINLLIRSRSGGN
jgi:hypothetical protein